MSQVTRFPNAPITEALLDIRAKLPSEVSLAKLATFHDSVREQYPAKQERVRWQGGIHFEPGGIPEIRPASGGPDGYRFTSTDGKQIVQARLDGFTFNKLKPYDRWETFRDEARRLWQHYLSIVAPESVTRIALRYINRIEIPLPMRDFKDYILTTPEIAPGLPQRLDSFFMRLVIPDPKTGGVTIVTETTEPITDSAQSLPFILDIDVFHVAAFAAKDEAIWEKFGQLRDLKNDIFFKSVTPRAKEMFL